ncbi:MAG: Asp-tRNA(Asn)/Glu-tRNA(Gln) amidotransferase subunit GatA [Bacteroidia bacterium]|nr:Asp-tRNA(Asn)/Glu-tRNA(Gln) amidotransferase subunit GatA [Bacteroidia bacterium]
MNEHRATESCLARLRSALVAIERQRALNAFIEVFGKDAYAQAAAADTHPPAGTASPVSGMLLGIKDNISIQGKACTAASRILQGYCAPFDATVITRLREAGAVFVGRCNMDEFAMGSSGETSAYGATRHPFLDTRVPGGSSSGSAAAVAAGLVDAALGSDTGGSIRQPAAFCGVVGMKPSWGRVSRYGLISFAPSFEQIGPIARSVRDAAALLLVMAGEDANDATTAARTVPDYPAACDRGVAGLRFGILDYGKNDSDDPFTGAALSRSAQALRQQGASLHPVHVHYLDAVLPVYYVIANVEAAGNLARYDGMRFGARRAGAHFEEAIRNARTEGFGAEVRRRLLQGAWIQGDGRQDEHYQRAQRVRTVLREEWERVFDVVDVVLTPVTKGPPFMTGERSSAMAMRASDECTAVANVAGLPAMSLPLPPTPEGFPCAVQLLARPFGEEDLFAAAAAIERACPAAEGWGA